MGILMGGFQLLQIAAIVAIALVVLITLMGGDAAWVADAFVAVALWLLPGIVISAVAGAITLAITQSLPLAAAFSGIILVVVTVFLRVAMWTGG